MEELLAWQCDQPMEQSRSMNKSTIDTIQIKACAFPKILANIPDPPKQIFIKGDQLSTLLERPKVAIVGSRKVSAYGRAVTTQLAAELARAGVVIVSGLAVGVDGIAHRAALTAGGQAIAVLAGGLDTIYSSHHAHMADEIVQRGGVLLSEYPPDIPYLRHQFVARNRLISGLCDALLITEAAEKSGTLHTASFALEQGKDVLVVPGNITSPTSAGTNRLLQTGAHLITCTNDVLAVLGIHTSQVKLAPTGDTPAEQTIIDLLVSGEQDGEVLFAKSGLAVPQYNQALTMLEITGKVTSLGGNAWVLQ